MERGQLEDEILKRRTDEKIQQDKENQNRINEANRARLEAELIENEENFQIALEIRRQQLELEREIELQNTELTEEERMLIEAKFSKMRQQLDDQERERRIANIQTVLDVQKTIVGAISSIGEIAIRNEEKAAKFNAITTAANMAIDSAGAIVAAVKSSAGIPFPANIPAIATAVGTVLANIATAVKAFRQAKGVNAPQLEGTGGAGGAGVTGESIAASSGIGGETTTDVAELLGESQKVRVELLESDVTDTQNRVQAQETLSTI